MGPEALADNYARLADLPTLTSLAAINTEYTVFDTTKVDSQRFGMVHQPDDTANVAFSRRRTCGHIKRAFLSIWADQVLTVFFKHLCAQIAAPISSDWKVVPDGGGAILGTATLASKLSIFSFPFTGDDHQITVKTGGTLPTIFQCSLRFTIDQALNA